MANYKVVDADKLDADLISVADAIRERSGTTEPLSFPDEMVAAVEPLVNKNNYLADICNGKITELVNDKITSIFSSFQSGNTNLLKVDLPLVTTLPSYAFYNCGKLTEAHLHSVTTTSSSQCYAFYGCQSLKKIYYPALTTITGTWFHAFNYSLSIAVFPVLTSDVYGATFSNNRRIKALVLGGNTLCALKNVDALASTPISGVTTYTAGEKGYIYVRSDLVDSYKAATNWSTFADQIRAIEDYPEIVAALDGDFTLWEAANE